MAGDAPGCKQWGEAYDQYARDTMQTCTHLADALTNFGNVLYANGYKYAIADNAKPQRPTLRQVSEYKVTIPLRPRQRRRRQTQRWRRGVLQRTHCEDRQYLRETSQR